jgi:hypothetical protein
LDAAIYSMACDLAQIIVNGLVLAFLIGWKRCGNRTFDQKAADQWMLGWANLTAMAKPGQIRV